MDPQWRERGLCSHSPPPLRSTPPAQWLGFTGSYTSLFKLPPRVPGKFIFSLLLPQPAPWWCPLSRGLLRSNSRLPKRYMFCTLLQRMRVVFTPPYTHSLRLSFGHFSRTRTFTYHSPSYIPGLIIMSPHSECFCPIECACCWTTFPPLIFQVVQLNAFASLHCLSQCSPTLLHSEYFCQCHFFFSFFFYLVCSGAFSSAREKKKKEFSLCCCYCTV